MPEAHLFLTLDIVFDIHAYIERRLASRENIRLTARTPRQGSSIGFASIERQVLSGLKCTEDSELMIKLVLSHG